MGLEAKVIYYVSQCTEKHNIESYVRRNFNKHDSTTDAH